MSVQQTILKGIKEQLFLNDYLVIPGFGGFVLKARSSHFSSTQGMLVPPVKTVSFNSQLKQNDGILAIWLQDKLSCSANESLMHLNDFSEFCAGILSARRRLSMEGIGFFYLDFENNTCFEPQQDVNFMTSSFGLTPVSVQAIEFNFPESKKEPVFVDRTLQSSVQTGKTIKHSRNYKRLVNPALFSIIFICLLGLLVSNSKIQGELRSSLFASESKGEFSPINYPDLDIQSIPASSQAYVADANGIATISLDHEKVIAVKALETGGNLHSKSGSFNHSSNVVKKGKFEIVLGCFAISANATRMVQQLSAKHVEASVTGKNARGMYVVSNGSFKTKNEAIQRLMAIKDTFPNAWIKAGEKF